MKSNDPARFVVTMLFASLAASALAQSMEKKPRYISPDEKIVLDRSGLPHEGEASYYGKSFYGRTMADGTPMDPEANIAASRTLPLGTIAEVTNLENGKSEVVEIRDRGPYIDGRIIDVSPKVAEKLDMLEDGVVRVVVMPLEVPQADGTVATGSGAAKEASAAE